MVRVRVYVPLTGVRGGLFTYNRLWEGADHLLSVQSTGVSESYRRFYYRDLQAIIIRKTSRWRARLIVLLTSTFACAAAGAVVDEPVFRFLTWLAAGVLLLVTAIQAIRGRSCVVHFQTSVQTEEIRSLRYLRKAERIVQRIAQAVAAEQPAPAVAISSETV